MLQTEENIKEADEIFREILRESGMTDEEIENIEPNKEIGASFNKKLKKIGESADVIRSSEGISANTYSQGNEQSRDNWSSDGSYGKEPRKDTSEPLE